MIMPKPTRTSGIALTLSLLVGASLQAQSNFDQVKIEATHVAGRVWMLEGAGGNIGVSAGPDGILIVDDQFAPLAEKIEAALKEINPGSLKFVLNTHWHGDHTGGNAHFGRSAVILAHENVRKRLVERTDPPTPAAGLPVITYEDGLSIHFNGEEIRLYHLPPGHTDGDSVVHFTESGVLHMGDLFFKDRFPFIDLNSGGNVAGYARNVRTVLDRIPSDIRIIPGHGALGSKADLERFHGALLDTGRIVQQAIAAGKSMEQVKAARLPEQWEVWGSGFISVDRWLDICYRGLSSQ